MRARARKPHARLRLAAMRALQNVAAAPPPQLTAQSQVQIACCGNPGHTGGQEAVQEQDQKQRK